MVSLPIIDDIPILHILWSVGLKHIHNKYMVRHTNLKIRSDQIVFASTSNPTHIIIRNPEIYDTSHIETAM